MESQNLRRLLIAMSQPSVEYVLGAGASAGLAPFTFEALDRIRQSYVDLGMFPVVSSASSPLFQRLIREPLVNSYKHSRAHHDDFLLETIPASALELLAQQAWSPRIRQVAPPQYSVLQRAARRAVVITFNLDDLARSYLRGRHRILEPHGRVDRGWTEHPDFDRLLELSLDVHLPSLAPKLLPGPEPSRITGTPPYAEARRYLNTGSAVIIIGYSFGMFRGNMDDAESFEHLLDSQVRQHCPIFVVDPNPEPLATRIEERLHSNRVIPVMLRWDVFSSALISLMAPRDELATWLSADRFEVIGRAYERCL